MSDMQFTIKYHCCQIQCYPMTMKLEGDKCLIVTRAERLICIAEQSYFVATSISTVLNSGTHNCLMYWRPVRGSAVREGKRGREGERGAE